MSTQIKKLESRYQIIKEIGDGMTAKVFQAFDFTTNKKVALKVLNQMPEKSWSKPTTEFFENEKNCIEKLCHNNIVKMVTHGKAKFDSAIDTEQESEYIALEYIDGVELIDFLRCKGALSESIARHIFKPLVQAINHIHSCGMVHRDIKSDNIMISDKCQPKILDFGFSSKISGEDSNGYFTSKLGTPAYMAPEIHFGAPYKGA